MSEFTWYTDLSQQFMERDYLLKNQTLEERVEIICSTAETILKKPGFGDKFKANLKKGWYSLSTPIWTNFGTDRGSPISCVSGETWINTKLDGGKQAKDIAIGDEVLTHRGRWRKVTDVITTKKRKNIYRLKVTGRNTNLYITSDHSVLTNHGWVTVGELNPITHLVAINRVIEIEESPYTINLRPFCSYDFVEVDGKLCKKSITKTKKPLKFVSYYSSPIADVEVTNDLAWAMGLWFAEGSLIKGKIADGSKRMRGVRVTLNSKTEQEVAQKWLTIIKNAFNIDGQIRYQSNISHGKKHQWLSVNACSQIVGNFFASFGEGCKNKTLPSWVLNLQKESLQAFLDGMIEGDGSVHQNGYTRITLANPKLVLQLYQIGLKLNKVMSLQMQEKACKLVSTRYTYTINFWKDNNLESARAVRQVGFHDGLSYGSILNLEPTNRVEDVYDFTVEEDHSFSAAGVVLHNCFGSYIEDCMESILFTQAEVGMMTKIGGGTSAYFGNLRGRGAPIKDNGESFGSVHFMQMFDRLINIVSQGKTRRGNFAAYLPIDHRDIAEFLTIRSEGHPMQDISFGVTVPDYWMNEMIAGDTEKRTIWAKVINARFNTGYPYIIFIDNANKNTVDVYRDKGMRINSSNLCSEIFLCSTPDESFVCNLSSMNINHFDEWKDTDAVELLVYFLDSVMTEFIEKTRGIKFLERAVNFAERQRALGIGWIGWHTYLQSHMIAFESMEAKLLNVQVAKTIHDAAYAASAKLAEEYGEPEYLKGYGRRNTTLLAIAPTKSSSFILGQVSEGIEPQRTNYYIKDLQKGKFTIKNKELERLLEAKGQNTNTVWNSIMKNSGSVQHLDCLTEQEKNVFKTFAEISPMEVIIQASQRQKYIDQSQSLNLMVHSNVPAKDVNTLLIEAWKLGVKSLYYQIGVSAAQEFSRNILSCSSCES